MPRPPVVPSPRLATGGLARRAALAALASATFVLACAGPSPSEEGDAPRGVATRADAIVNGELDTTRPAVVLLESSGGACSGTIVKKDVATGIAWVLSAAHCVETTPNLVVQAEDTSRRDIVRYPVLDATADPTYDGRAGSPGDFAVLRVAGAGPDTPVIPLTTAPDGLTVGTTVVDVGYGRTTPLDQAPDANVLRRNFTVAIARLDAELVGVSSNGGGICSGDSGGPSLVGAPGAERVVAVHSFVQGTCARGGAYSARVTSRLAWIEAELAKAPALEGCRACLGMETSGERTCGKLERACRADEACARYASCMGSCGTGPACKNECYARAPAGEVKYELVYECACAAPCGAACGGERSACTDVPACGERFGQGACAACAERACCGALAACSADEGCHACVRPGTAGAEGCEQTEAERTLDACVRASCADACVLAPERPDAPAADVGPTTAAVDVGAGADGGRADAGCGVARRAGTQDAPWAFVVAWLVVRRLRRPRAT